MCGLVGRNKLIFVADSRSDFELRYGHAIRSKRVPRSATDEYLFDPKINCPADYLVELIDPARCYGLETSAIIICQIRFVLVPL
jgi:hypothetical protein